MRVACVLVTHLGARVEMRRHPHLKDRPAVIIDRFRGKPLVADRFPAASGVKAGMTMEEALSRHAGSVVLEADGPAYRSVFHRMLVSLQGVSDRVEGEELGTAYTRIDGLEAMYGGEARLVAALLNAAPQYLAPRVGVGGGKFPAFVAARAARPLGAFRAPRDAAAFLAPHPVDLLPISIGARADMQRFGLRTLGDVAAVRQELLIDRFGPEGGTAWELSRGIDRRFLAPVKYEESVAEPTSLPFASASLDLLLAAVDTLLRRAYARPQMRGRYSGGATLECILFGAPSWKKDFRFKQPAGTWERASGIIRGQLEADHPQTPVEEVVLSLTGLTGESGVQVSLLEGVRHGRESRLVEADRQLQVRAGGRPGLYRVVQVAPWHPAPEMRAMQVPIDASAAADMRPLSVPTPVTVQEGPEGEPAAVRLGERWRHVARIEDLWCFDLWWMPQPLTRTYYRVGREDGGEVTLFRDRRENRWFRQDP